MEGKIICGQYDIFENMNKSFALLPKDEITDNRKLVQNHLQLLRDLLENYFPDLNDFDFKLIRNLFEVDPRLLPHNCKMNFLNFWIIQLPKILLNSQPC